MDSKLLSHRCYDEYFGSNVKLGQDDIVDMKYLDGKWKNEVKKENALPVHCSVTGKGHYLPQKSQFPSCVIMTNPAFPGVYPSASCR